MADLALEKPSAGSFDVDVTFTTPTGSAGTPDTFPNPNGRTQLIVKNGSGADVTLTVKATGKCNHGFLHDAVATIAAGAEKTIGPFPKARFRKEDARVDFYFSSNTNVSVAATEGANF